MSFWIILVCCLRYTTKKKQIYETWEVIECVRLLSRFRIINTIQEFQFRQEKCIFRLTILRDPAYRLEKMSKCQASNKIINYLERWNGIHFNPGMHHQHIFSCFVSCMDLYCQIWLNETQIRLSHCPFSSNKFFYLKISIKAR